MKLHKFDQNRMSSIDFDEIATKSIEIKSDADENLQSITILPLDPFATFYFLTNGIGKDRQTIFKNAFPRFRLQLISNVDDARFIVADDQFDSLKIFSILKMNMSESHEKALPTLIRTKWLSDSLKQKSLVPLTNEYLIRLPMIRKSTATPSFSQQATTELLSKNETKLKRRLSDDAPKGGSATQVKQRRYSSDENSDQDFSDVSLRFHYYSLLLIHFYFRTTMIQLKILIKMVNYR